MNRRILDHEVQQFIQDHLNDHATHIALQKSPFAGVSPAELATQIDGKQRCEKKLPLWYHTPGIYFPPKLNLEQASSEITAAYKSTLVKGSCVIDLTGGFGVDAWYFAAKARDVYHIEQNAELSEIAAHNCSILKADNIHFVHADSIHYLKAMDRISGTIYADPARRVQSRKVFLLKDMEPDVTSFLPLMLQKADRIIIKTSPLLDIQSGLKELSHVTEVHVVSVKNDCKELLWIIDKGFEGEAQICCAMPGSDSTPFRFYLSEERNAYPGNYSEPLTWLYEPDVSLLKAGCFKLIAERYHLQKLHPGTHLYTSEALNHSFPGRKFRVISSAPYKVFAQDRKATRANIITRNFPFSTEELKKKYQFRDGGNRYLLFATAPSGTLTGIEAERL